MSFNESLQEWLFVQAVQYYHRQDTERQQSFTRKGALTCFKKHEPDSITGQTVTRLLTANDLRKLCVTLILVLLAISRTHN